MLKTAKTSVTELKAGDLIFDIQPETSQLLPALFRVVKVNKDILVAEGMDLENNRGYHFSYVDDKKCISFSISNTSPMSTWHKLVY